MKKQLVRFPHEEMPVDRVCPDYERKGHLCMAATGFMVSSRRQQMRYCVTSDYDNCPIYLGKALRSSCSQGFARESLVDSGK